MLFPNMVGYGKQPLTGDYVIYNKGGDVVATVKAGEHAENLAGLIQYAPYLVNEIATPVVVRDQIFRDQVKHSGD